MIKTFARILFFMMISYSLFAGDKASQILEQYHFTQTEVEDLLTQHPELADLVVAFETSYFDEINPEYFTLKLYAEMTNDVYIIQKDEEKVEIKKTFVPFEVQRKTFEGTIKGTLFETLKADTLSEKIAAQVADAFKEEFTTTKGLKVGATYSLDVIEFFDNGVFVKYGDVLKTSLVIGKAIATRILKQDFETLEWNLLPLVPVIDKPFYAPVKMSRVSSLFQLARRHPVKRRLQPHNGIDFVARAGTPVYPALEGEIIAIGRARAKGKFILIQHDNGYQTTYDHLRKFGKGLRVGMRVSMDEQIGEVGKTGYATGAHLHFGVLKDGFYVNPLYLVKDYTYDQKDHFEVSDFEEVAPSDEEISGLPFQ